MRNSIILLILATLLMAGCAATSISPNTYKGDEIGKVDRTIVGTVVSMRRVKIDNSSHVGGLAGAGAGAVAGSAIGNNTRTNTVGAIGGAVVGGLVGAAVDEAMHKNVGYEYILRVKRKGLISIVQAKDLKLHVGQKVYVIYGDMTRIVPVKK